MGGTAARGGLRDAPQRRRRHRRESGLGRWPASQPGGRGGGVGGGGARLQPGQRHLRPGRGLRPLHAGGLAQHAPRGLRHGQLRQFRGVGVQLLAPRQLRGRAAVLRRVEARRPSAFPTAPRGPYKANRRKPMTDRYAAADLITFAAAMLAAAGLDADKATTTAEILVEGDLMGHTTHGLALLGQNLDEAEAGRMLGTGEPEVVAATSAIETWDGRRLPGPWLVRRAADRASANAAEIGLAGVVIRKSCHIGCLAAYLKRVTDRGQIMLLF